MLHASTKISVIVAAVAVLGGVGVADAAAGTAAASSRRGTEYFALMVSTTATRASIIATGLFTDGGTIPLSAWAPKPATTTITLGRGTIRLHETPGSITDKLDGATCLETARARGSYKLSRGTGRYTRISGSGRYTATGRLVFGRTAGGACATWRPIADQLVIALSGPVTLRH